jgi:predicted TIM-barrel fold metal-dependent hydrolase
MVTLRTGQWCDRLDVPVYIHPSPASKQLMQDQFRGEYADVIANCLSTKAWDSHSDVGLHIIKPFAASVFREYPRLKIIAGPMGEMIPMMIDCIDWLKVFQRGGCGSFREICDKASE